MRKPAFKRKPPKKQLFKVESVDIEPLKEDIPEDFREPFPVDLESGKPDTSNWSESQDRGEDLINETDPYTQQPERDTQIPSELVQERAYRLFEQRGRVDGENLADWFEAERQLHGEFKKRNRFVKKRAPSIKRAEPFALIRPLGQEILID